MTVKRPFCVHSTVAGSNSYPFLFITESHTALAWYLDQVISKSIVIFKHRFALTEPADLEKTYWCREPEWKLITYDGNPLNWHEWYGQVCSAVDSTHLCQDVKLTYLKTLVTGKAKTAITNFAYCGAMYTEALKTLEKNVSNLFGKNVA